MYDKIPLMRQSDLEYYFNYVRLTLKNLCFSSGSSSMARTTSTKFDFEFSSSATSYQTVSKT